MSLLGSKIACKIHAILMQRIYQSTFYMDLTMKLKKNELHSTDIEITLIHDILIAKPSKWIWAVVSMKNKNIFVVEKIK